MAEALSSKSVAQHLKTDARTLRRFLRDDPTYRNAGSGGRYTFTDRDLPTLSKRFAAWGVEVEKRRAKRDTTGLQKRRAPAEEPEVITIPKCTPLLRELERAQIARLDTRLRECGLHLSQLGRPEWADVEPAVAS